MQLNTLETITKNEFGDVLHLIETDHQISCNEDLIMFLREGDINPGDFEYSHDYQFNGFYLPGSDLIDLCKKYGV